MERENECLKKDIETFKKITLKLEDEINKTRRVLAALVKDLGKGRIDESECKKEPLV